MEFEESPSFVIPVQLLNPFFCSRMVSMTSFVFPRSFPSVLLQLFSLNHYQSSPIVAQFVRGYFSSWNSRLFLLGHHRDVFWSKRMRRLCCQVLLQFLAGPLNFILLQNKVFCSNCCCRSSYYVSLSRRCWNDRFLFPA